jgi:hypothetical protein
MVIIKQRGVTERAFNVVNTIINNINTTVVFSYYKPNPYRERPQLKFLFIRR